MIWKDLNNTSPHGQCRVLQQIRRFIQHLSFIFFVLYRQWPILANTCNKLFWHVLKILKGGKPRDWQSKIGMFADGEKNRMSIITKQKSFLLISCRCQTIWHQGRNIKYVNIELSIFTQFWQFLPPWHSNNCVVTRPSTILYSTVHVQCTSMSIQIFIIFTDYTCKIAFGTSFSKISYLKFFKLCNDKRLTKICGMHFYLIFRYCFKVTYHIVCFTKVFLLMKFK